MATKKKKQMEPLPEELGRLLRACYTMGKLDCMAEGMEKGEIEKLPGIFMQQLEGMREYFAQIIDQRVDHIAPHEQEYMRQGVIEFLRKDAGA